MFKQSTSKTNMTEQATATIDQTVTATRTPEHRAPQIERIWHAADVVINERLAQAHSQIMTKIVEAEEGAGSDRAHIEAKVAAIDNTQIVQHARNLQYEHLVKADPDDITTAQITADRIALALLEAPAATRAQREMDAHRQKGLRNADYDTSTRAVAHHNATLIHFSDHLGQAAEYMRDDMVETFSDRLYSRMNNILAIQYGQEIFTPSEYAACIAGVSREVAMQKALRDELPAGYDVRSSTVVENARGVDKIASDDEGREIGMDVKADQTYRVTVNRLGENGSLTQTEVKAALEDGYFYRRATDPRDRDLPRMVVNADTIGDFDQATWSYDNPDVVSGFVVEELAKLRKRALRQIGNSAITR
jgi:hypothetical protein